MPTYDYSDVPIYPPEPGDSDLVLALKANGVYFPDGIPSTVRVIPDAPNSHNTATQRSTTAHLRSTLPSPSAELDYDETAATLPPLSNTKALVESAHNPRHGLQLIGQARRDYEELIPIRNALISQLLGDGCSKRKIAQDLGITHQALATYKSVRDHALARQATIAEIQAEIDSTD